MTVSMGKMEALTKSSVVGKDATMVGKRPPAYEMVVTILISRERQYFAVIESV